MGSRVQPPDELHLSYDRKVSPAGKLTKWKHRKVWVAKAPNSFGLPAGTSCPGKTSFCVSCYGKNTENYSPDARKLLAHNWEILSGASFADMVIHLDVMMDRFEWNWIGALGDEPMIFRIHWDGDFFSADYLRAWVSVMKRRPHITFWAYTRSFDLITRECHLPNFTLYLSIDAENEEAAAKLRDRYRWLRGAYCASAFRQALAMAPGACVRCPENAQTAPLVNGNGQGACTTCRLCITGKADIAFASTHREDVSVNVHRRQEVLF